MTQPNQDLELRQPGAAAVKSNDEIPTVLPPVDIYENAEEYLVHADLPGVKEASIDIQFDRGDLSLFAERNGAGEGESLGTEFGPVAFRRSFRIPEQVDTANIKAKYFEGVLEVHLPKSPDVRPRKIAIEAS